MSYELDPYDPCPCGSGKKYKFCCSKKNTKGRYPVGTIAHYGPDDKTCTKIAAAVVRHEHDKHAPLLRFVGTNVVGDPKIIEQIKAFFVKHRVKNIVVTDGVIGCPHEEGPDFPLGEDCPFCPFWAGKQGTAQRD